MHGLNQRQRVKINAALSLIYSQGYDAQTVVSWARAYNKNGYEMRSSYQQALNDFVSGQPDLAPTLGKITRLIEHSDVPTVAKYEQALSAYIESGDDRALNELGPVIAADSVALARQHGELTGDVSADNVEAALGLALADGHVQAAAQPAPSEPARECGWDTSKGEPQVDPGQAVASPFGAGAFTRAKDRAKWEAAPYLGAGEPRSLLAGHTVGTVDGSPQANAI